MGTAAYADVVLLPVAGADDPADLLTEVRGAISAVGRDPEDVRILFSASVLLADSASVAAQRDHALATLAGRPHPIDVVGTPSALVARAGTWLGLGADGVHLRPAVLGVDLPRLLDDVVPTLRNRPYAAHDLSQPITLRDRLGPRRRVGRSAATAS